MNKLEESAPVNPMPAQAAGNRQIVGLDLLRFAAAMIVMIYHLAFVIWATHRVGVNYRYLGAYAWPGWIGVEVFFLLSGFIISFSAQNVTAETFAKSRFIRLYPTAWICSTFTAIVLLLARDAPMGLNIIHRWLTTNLLFVSGPYLDPSYWTLQVELCFYLLVFLLLFFKQFRYLITAMITIGLVSTAYIASYATLRYYFPHFVGTGRALLFIDSPLSRAFLLTYGCFFAVGSLLWACLLEHTTAIRLLALFVCISGCLIEVRIRADIDSEFFHSSYSWLPPLLLWVTALLAIVVAVKFNPLISSILEPPGVRIARTLGLMTYPLYLIHQAAGYIFVASLRRVMPDLAALVISITLCIVLSLVIHTYLERPAQRYLHHVLRGRSKSAMVAEMSLTNPVQNNPNGNSYESSNA